MTLTADDRVGDALDGAYLIWDTLLCRLNAELQCFESLVEHMFQHMVQPSKADAKSDAFKAAMYDWILHVLTSTAWLSVCPHRVRQEVWATTMTACMTQPGYWSKKLAKELLLEGDDDFQDEWLPIFEASLPDGEGKSSEADPKNEHVPEPQSDEEMQDAMYVYKFLQGMRHSLTVLEAPPNLRHPYPLTGRPSHVPVAGGSGQGSGNQLPSAWFLHNHPRLYREE